MDLTALSSLHLAAIAAGGWLFSLACFTAFWRPRRTRRLLSRSAPRPANIIDFAERRDRHERVYGGRRAA